MWFPLRLRFCLTFSVLVCLNANLLTNSASSLQPSCHDHERSALLLFKSSFRTDCSVSYDPYVILTPIAKTKSWIDGPNADCCSWQGIECSTETGHVIGLNLTASCLFGTFPPNSTLFSLNHLKKLLLDLNDFNDSHIPSKIGQLHKLQVLKLLGSSFRGRIPSEISKLWELSTITFGERMFGGISKLKLEDGSLSRLAQNLTHLEQLWFCNVDIFSNVPTVLTNLTSLKGIALPYCNLYGELPSDIFHLPHLNVLFLDGNPDLYGSLPEFELHSPLEQISLFDISMSGELPPSIGRLARLEVLSADSCQFSGLIPSSLGNLTKLHSLDLSSNSFSGVIPPSISNLTNLEELRLVDLTVLPGQFVSQLGMLRKLENLGLSGMSLRIQHPSFLANLTRLTCLDLSNNKGGGPLPLWLANLTQLTQLFLHHSNLDGPIPPWFSHLSNLQALDLSFNKLSPSLGIFSNFEKLEILDLSGLNIVFPPKYMTNSTLYNLQELWLNSCNLAEFPQFLSNQNELELLSLDDNHIEGVIPQWFMNVTRDNLSVLGLSSNNLTGFEQPVAVLPWINLSYFGIGGNKFHGPLPAPSASLVVYDVSNNEFSGDIPKQFCVARSLIKLDLSNNNLSGVVPHCIGDQLGDSLQLLNLRGNSFHGRIPPIFSTSCKIKMINLSQNQLEGRLPRSLANCRMLEVLDIGQNYVNDTFPSWLPSMPNLQVLVLRHNNFHESITDQNLEVCFHSLRIIDMSTNFFTGNLPSGYLKNWQNMMVSKEDKSYSSHTEISFPLGVNSAAQTFEYTITITNKRVQRLYPKILDVLRLVDFSSNKFSGEIPNIIGELKGLQALNLSNNNLEGEIPSSLANMTDLESLDLSQNMLSGSIPLELSHLTSLEVFDISYNRLNGPIPQGSQFNTFDNSSYEGNPGLCGSPLSKECRKADVPESPTISDESKEDSEWWIDWIIRSSGCLGGFIVGYVIGKLYITDKHHEWFMDTFQRQPKRRVKRAAGQRR